MRLYENKLTQIDMCNLEFNHRIPDAATSRKQISESGGKCGTSEEVWNGYADDTTLYQLSAENIKKCLNILGEIYKQYHLTLNTSKTKTMVWNHNVDFEVYPNSIMTYNSMTGYYLLFIW